MPSELKITTIGSAELARLREIEAKVKELLEHQNKLHKMSMKYYIEDNNRMWNELRELTGESQ